MRAAAFKAVGQRGGLSNGITVNELEQAILQTVPYCGCPAAGHALEAAAAVLEKRGIDVTTAKERSIL